MIEIEIHMDNWTLRIYLDLLLYYFFLKCLYISVCATKNAVKYIMLPAWVFAKSKGTFEDGPSLFRLNDEGRIGNPMEKKVSR